MAKVCGGSACLSIGPGTTLAALLFAVLIPSPGCSLLLRPESRDLDASGADADMDVDQDEDLDDADEPDVDKGVDVEPDTEHGSDADDAETCSVCHPGFECNDAGICECVPECGERQCGDNGCAGACGSCPAGATCTDEGRLALRRSSKPIPAKDSAKSG